VLAAQAQRHDRRKATDHKPRRRLSPFLLDIGSLGRISIHGHSLRTRAAPRAEGGVFYGPRAVNFSSIFMSLNQCLR
jgi:hypothetical protein